MSKAPYLVATTLAFSTLLTTSSALAATYTLELVGKPTWNGSLVSFSVQLINDETKAIVPDVVLNIDDFNMEPEGMSGSSTVHPKPSGQPGILNFEVQPIMAGRWGLEYTARVPQEPGPIKDTLVVRLPEKKG